MAKAPDSTKILIVDDDPAAVELMQYLLQEEGFQTALAVTGVEGLAMAKGERPDLILLDVMLPELDGLQVCQELRADPATAGLPIIMLSAKAQTSDCECGQQAGADLYLTKPIDLTDLIQKVTSLLHEG
jgi:two-component system alkaline phosphatase synthesis response regulator PhoP